MSRKKPRWRRHPLASLTNLLRAARRALHGFLVPGGAGGSAQVHLAWVDEPSTTLTVVWRTGRRGTPSLVQFRQAGTEPWVTAAGGRRPCGGRGVLHEATLTGLEPATAYDYRVQRDGEAWSRAFTARTAPAPGPADIDAVFLADTGLVGRRDGLTTATRHIVDAVAALHPLVVLPGGDYAYFRSDRRFGRLDDAIDAWFEQMEPIASRCPLMPTYGNHEVLLSEGFDAWAAHFPTPPGFDGRRNYAFDVGDVRFISVFAVQERDGLTAGQLCWLEGEIRAGKAAGRRWIIPYMHVSAFADGINHPSNLELRCQLGPLFERLGVRLVISAHDQAYERTWPLVDVPRTNTPTATGGDCFGEDDGVTWVKVSPAGKLSNKNRSQSQFASATPPPWTAFRDNGMHYFARISVRAEGTLRFEAWGVTSDGGAPVLRDSFSYRLGRASGVGGAGKGRSTGDDALTATGAGNVTRLRPASA